MKLVFQFISVTFFVLFDRLLFMLLEIIARHSRVNYLQEGVHNLNITVDGKGFLASLIRDAIDGFKIDEHIKVVTSNEPCLPRPVEVASWRIFRIYLLFALNFYLILNQVYIHRLKRFVCSYIYPKREKTRVLYLYNKLLKRRENSFKMMLQRVEEKVRVQGREQKQNFFQVIYEAKHS